MPSGIYRRLPQMYDSRRGRRPWNKGLSKETDDRIRNAKRVSKLSEDHKRHLGESHRGLPSSMGMLGKRHSKETIEKMKLSAGKGENHHRYIQDRSKLVKKQQRNDSAYKEWRQKVWVRDDFKCQIADENCKGRKEVHHILSWKEYPELHYEITNGITLCHAHHPRTKSEEKRLAPKFIQLVSESNG